MITEKVYSPVKDERVKNSISNSPIWKQCYKEEDLTQEVLDRHDVIHVYTVKFEGVTPVQVTKISQLSLKERDKISLK